jgi:predicted DNA-binding protein YlxM (UPF0122 family)
MLSKKEITQKTVLSRQTVHKHLKEYKTQPLFLEIMEQLSFMSSKLRANVFIMPLMATWQQRNFTSILLVMPNNGKQQNNTMIQNQNNYIQINGTVLSQEIIQQLNAE